MNLLIADDVGAGKTVEAGLILRELLLRRRIDFVLVAAPAGIVRQWQDELEAKFGLAFAIIDRDYLTVLRGGMRSAVAEVIEIAETFCGRVSQNGAETPLLGVLRSLVERCAAA